MKSLFICFLVAVGSVSGGSLVSNLISHLPGPATTLGYPLSNDPNDIHFYFYPLQGTPANRQEIIYGNSSTISSTSFNPNLLTVILIHGFSDNSTGAFAASVKAYLASPLNYNYIVVDWGRLSGNNPNAFSEQYILLSTLIYTQVVKSSIAIVANRTTQFIEFLNLNPALVHIVGHSLGAHVSGLAGRNYQANNGGKQLERITGLDPAGPLYFITFPFPKLNKDNAAFVDIIHTNMGEFGEVSVDGDVDFFPNLGITQPGCNLVTDESGCSHGYAPKIYAASISKPFPACQCISLQIVNGLLNINLLNGTDLEICLENCATDFVLLGEPCPSTASGLYYITTPPLP